MCNLYTLRKGPASILDLARAMRGDVGNLEPRDLYPDYPAPIGRTGTDGERPLEAVAGSRKPGARALHGLQRAGDATRKVATARSGSRCRAMNRWPFSPAFRSRSGPPSERSKPGWRPSISSPS